MTRATDQQQEWKIEMICVEGLNVRVGTFVLKDITFSIPAGGYAALMGRTGSGKTTLLEVLCGLKPTARGRVQLMDRDVTHLKPAERGIGYVPQDRALFTTMTVEEHLAFALLIRRWDRDAIARRVNALAELLGLRHLLSRRPAGLSGGESQRVALGRALAFRPGVLLLDEPLSALDDETREEMIALLQSVRAHTEVTTLHVTHRAEEVRRLADQTLLLRDGTVRIQQSAVEEEMGKSVATEQKGREG